MKLKTKTRVALCVAALSGTGITASQVIASDIEPYSVPVSIKGEKQKDYFGMTMTTIGKFSDKDNGSHIAGEDIVITAPWGDGAKGIAYVIFGTSGGKPMQQVNNVGEFDPQNALKIIHSNKANKPGSVTTKWMGVAVRKIGDINGDGYDDLVIASHWHDQVYIIWGGPHHRTGARLSNQIDLNDIDNGDARLGIRIRTVNSSGNANTGGWFGAAVGPIKYKNSAVANKMVDLAIGDIEGTGGRGGAIIIYGAQKPGDQWRNIDIKRNNLGDWEIPAATGAYIRPQMTATNGPDKPLNYNLGQQISDVGDINGDGFSDYLIVDPESVNEGRKSENSGTDGRGTAYLVYGSSFNQGNLDIASLNATQATRIHGMGAAFLGGQSGGGEGSNDHSAYTQDKPNNGTITPLGNFLNAHANAFAISAPADMGIDKKRSGLVWIIKGKADGSKLPSSLFLDAAHTRLNYNKTFSVHDGYAIYADRPGSKLAGFGNSILGNVDLNGDGKKDLVIGDPNAVNGSGTQVGAVYVINGGKSLDDYADDEEGMININTLVREGVAKVYWGKNQYEKFGASIAAGSFNGFTQDSLAIGSYRDNTWTGKVTFRIADYAIPD
ncbi:TPA: integrin alpha [Enterobacter bugandensis]|uniref:FG-GAP repeat n=1 Tax=Enterobacter bugandensis TaxID=881260 RepID=A0A822X3B4_9ENTR|nr:integrin alpha [Enterobacter bugandensis]MCK6897919.1 integrin alpha [Enterobacter bugandensis]MCK7399916.1 integrin alpha [Enterobacter bugandensis]MCK7435358.1 integrin alpha [Enterobacter bugandensis]QCE27384.1 hypothetical protein FAI37_08065 [Enterobacter bugandensis]CZX97161.1 FG-GAP repeat [Enterobacter bugandensis]